MIEKNLFVWKCVWKKNILTLDLNITTEMKWSMYASPSSNWHTLLSKQLQYKNSSRKDESE